MLLLCSSRPASYRMAVPENRRYAPWPLPHQGASWFRSAIRQPDDGAD